MSELDIDHEMYLKFEDYRYNARAEGARPMEFAAWKSTPIAQSYLKRLEAPATEPTAAAQGEVCRCGYPMADHDADGECPGDGYTGQRSPDQILTPTELVHLWREMKADPHDIHKQLAYFKSLADARLTDGYKFIDERNALAAERASLEAALQQAQRERDAANELLAKIERRMPMVQPFDLGAHYYSETYNAWLVGDWIRAYQKAASAQQAANAEGGA